MDRTDEQPEARNAPLQREISARERAEEELRWKTAFLEAQVHSSIDGILVVDSQGKKLLQNQQMTDLWGIPPAIANDPDDTPQLKFCTNQTCNPEEFRRRVEYLYAHPEEVSRDEIPLKHGKVLDRYSSPVIGKKGENYGRIWVFRDITERNRAEAMLQTAHDQLEQRVAERTGELKEANERLEQTNRLLHILTECSQQVVRATEEKELLEAICRIIVQLGGYPATWVGYAEDNQVKKVRPVAHKGFEDGYLDSLTIVWSDTPLGRGPTGSAIRSGKPCIIDDLRTDPGYAPWREESLRRGYASSIGLPLWSGGRVFGALTIHARTPGAFHTREVEVLVELAGDLAYGIMALRARNERRRAEEQVRRLADLQSAILNNAAYMVISTEPDGVITSINPAAEKALGYAAAECVGKMSPTVFHVPEEVAERAGVFSKELEVEIEPGFEVFVARARRDLPNEYEWTYQRKDGTRFPVLLSVTALRDSKERVIGFLGLANDITERKRTEGEIRRLNRDLERRVAERTAELAAANRELQTFSYSVSHDLRSPLRTVSGFSRLLQEDYGAQLGTEAQDYLENICASAERMDHLIQGLLNLSHITRREIHRQTVDLSAMARTIAREMQTAEPGRRVEFVLAEGLKAEGDAVLLRSVLQNILGNAWKYTGKHPGGARIEFGGEKRGGETVFYVRDDGAGFDQENAGKLFVAFQRLHRAGEFSGTGIGLATVQRIIERHGGRIWAEGEVEKGATFYFTLEPKEEGTEENTKHQTPSSR